MADIQLQTLLNSGDITGIKLGGVSSTKDVLTREEIATLMADKLDSTYEDALINLIAIQTASLEPTGFNLKDNTTHGIMELCPVGADGYYWRIDENNTFSKITGATTFGDGTTLLADRTFAHYPSGGQTEFSFWNRGTKHTKASTQTIQLDNVSSKQIICYDSTGSLILEDIVEEAITENTLVSIITGNPTLTQKVIFANERHGKEMNGSTHMMLHSAIGTIYGDGFDISGMADNGNTFTSISAGSIWDEDLFHESDEVATAPFSYRDANGSWALEVDVNNDAISTNELPFTNGTAADSLYNRDNGDGTWSLVDTGSDYVINHFFATNDGEFRIFKVVGQTLYADRTTARRHLDGEIVNISVGDLPTPEFLHLYSYILDGNGNIETGADGEIYTDYRFGYPISRY